MDKKDDVPMADAVVAPQPVEAVTVVDSPLMSNKGFLIRQDRQAKEWFIQDCLGLWCIEYDNNYDYAPLGNQRAMKKLNDSRGWRPNQTVIDTVPKTLRTKEQSDCTTKCVVMTLGCSSCRPFKMDLKPIAGEDVSYTHISRDFALGGCLCMPHNAVVYMEGQPVARVIEDWNCGNWLCRYCEAICCCRVPYNIQLIQNNSYANRYKINVNFCGCGPHCNLLGSTILCNDALWDIVDYTNHSRVAGRIQKTYGGCCSFGALTRWLCCHADNFIVEWEDDTTIDERASMIAATTLIEYVFYEHRIGLSTFYVASFCSSL